MSEAAPGWLRPAVLLPSLRPKRSQTQGHAGAAAQKLSSGGARGQPPGTSAFPPRQCHHKHRHSGCPPGTPSDGSVGSTRDTGHRRELQGGLGWISFLPSTSCATWLGSRSLQSYFRKWRQR